MSQSPLWMLMITRCMDRMLHIGEPFETHFCHPHLCKLMVVQTLQAILDRFICFVEAQGMSVNSEEIQPSEENKGILGLERDYEGGFAMLTIHWLAE